MDLGVNTVVSVGGSAGGGLAGMAEDGGGPDNACRCIGSWKDPNGA